MRVHLITAESPESRRLRRGRLIQFPQLTMPLLAALTRLRSDEGYMAEFRRDPETSGWLFVENHCPICAAARLCTGLCREELALFRRVLGKDVRVERVSHILAGAKRCAYRVTAI